MKGRVTQRVGKNALSLFVMQVGTRGLSLWLMAHLSRATGVEGLGRYILAMTVQGVALAVAEWGLNVYATRELAHLPSEEDTASILGTLLGLKVSTSLAMTLLLNFVIAPLFFPDRTTLIALASLALLPEAINNGLISLTRALQRMEVSSATILVVRAFTTLAGISLLSLGYDERAVLIVYAVGSVISFLILLWFVRSWKVYPTLAALPRTGWGHLRAATPFAITGIVALLYRRMDLMLLSYWGGDALAGIYGAAYRTWETLGIVPASLLDALFPEMVRRERQLGRGSLLVVYRRGLWVMSGLIVGLSVSAWLLAPLGMRVLIGDAGDLNVVVRVFRWLLIGLPFAYLYLLSGHALYAMGNQRRVTFWMALVTLANGVFNAVFIPRWQIAGAVGVALFSEIALFLALTVAAVRCMVQPRSKADL